MVAAEEDVVVQVRIKCRLERTHTQATTHQNAGVGPGVVDLTCRVEEVLFPSTSHQLAIGISSATWYRLATTRRTFLHKCSMN
jgi:hypothetical protein